MLYRLANNGDTELFLKNRMDFVTSIRHVEDIAVFENQTRKYLREHMGTDDLIIFLALENDNIIASCMACIYVTAPLPSCPSGKVAEILNVYTQAEYRRKGHARTLLNLLIAETKKRGVEKLKLDYTEDGFVLYESIGFTLSEHQMYMNL